VLLHIHPGNQLAFYETAVTLIPLLLFGGVVAERVGPRGDNPRNLMFLGIVIAVIGSYAIIAELFAIDAVVTGKPSFAAEFLTVTFLFGGMIGAVTALVYPWYARLGAVSKEARDRAQPGGQDIQAEIKRKRRTLGWTTGVLLAVVFFSAAVVALVSLDEAGRDQFSEAQSAAITQKTTEQAAVRSRILALLVAEARVEQQASSARTQHEPNAIIGGYQAEILTLKTRLGAERGNDRRLIRAISALRHEEYGKQESEME
jgi:branched-subunit amino acid permease